MQNIGCVCHPNLFNVILNKISFNKKNSLLWSLDIHTYMLMITVAFRRDNFVGYCYESGDPCSNQCGRSFL